MTDWLAYVLGFIALIFVFLPHWLDPVILWREKIEGWEPEKSRSRRSRIEIIGAIIVAILFATIGAGAVYLLFRGHDCHCGVVEIG